MLKEFRLLQPTNLHQRCPVIMGSKNEVERYVAVGESMDKAGAYAIQGVGSYLVESITGSYTNVVGLPLCQVIQMMEEMGATDFLP
jgi:predicted house-cleaning NTP pyrophosphatase (Maf/HAM1 superfamily)